MAGLLASLLGALGLGRSNAAKAQTPRTVAIPQPPTEQELLDRLGFPVITVPGSQALVKWEELRARDEGYPVVLGDDEALSFITDLYGFEERPSVETVLERSSALDFPEAVFELRRKEAEQFGGSYDDDYSAETGDWPATAPSAPGLTVQQDILTGAPFERVHIGILPTDKGWEAPAYLTWGGWNENPAPEYHVAALRSWHERFGAQLVGLSGDVLNIRVARRPQSHEEALELAREHYAYCLDIVDQGVGTLANLAASYLESDWWYFWWD